MFLPHDLTKLAPFQNFEQKFFVVLVLFLFGGEVIHTFAFAMIIGVIIGTYSSIFIASNAVVKMGSAKA